MASDDLGLKIGEKDSLGYEVLRVFSQEDNRYIIYETTTHLVICDGPVTGEALRHRPKFHNWVMKIADLTTENARLQRMYAASIAHAYKLLFDGEAESAEATLEEIYHGIEGSLGRMARIVYLLGAFALMLIAPLVSLAAYRWGVAGELAVQLYSGVIFAAMGGFLSVALRTLQLGIDIRQSLGSNLLYGAFRIVIAIISGIVACFLVRAGIVLAFLKNASGADGMAIVTFLAGFSERFVPNLLARMEETASHAQLPSAGRSGEGRAP